MPTQIPARGKTIELDPKKFYLIIFDRRHITREDASNLQNYMKQQGVQGVSVLVNGDPQSVKIIEQNKKRPNA